MDESFVTACVERYLTGSQAVSIFCGVGRQLEMKDCYHYWPSGFRRYRALDAAVLATRSGLRLCVNHFSASKERLRISFLYRCFDQHNAALDPERAKERGDALLVEDDFDGPYDQRGQWEYIKRRYGVLISRGLEAQMDGMIRIPLNGDGRES